MIDHVPELVAEMRSEAEWSAKYEREDHRGPLFADAATALESLHAEVERLESVAFVHAGCKMIHDSDVQYVLDQVADRDARIAEALAARRENLPGRVETPLELVHKMRAILSRSPRGAASDSRSSLPVHQCRAPETHYGHRWREVDLDHDEWCMGRAFDDPSWVATGIAP